MRLLDLFCCGGGAAYGYHLAGFTEIVGVDHRPQPHYPFTFVEGDAFAYLAAHGHEFAAVHASPPCQRYSRMKHFATHEHPDLLPQTRDALRACGRPWVIENVVGAPMDVGLVLCGTMFGLQTDDGAQLQRHRLFESSVLLFAPGPCAHGSRVLGMNGHDWRNEALRMQYRSTISIAGGSPRGARARTITVTGQTPQQNVVRNQVRETFTLAQAQQAMGIDWLPRAALSQAIPPAYTQWIGRQLLRALQTERGTNAD